MNNVHNEILFGADRNAAPAARAGDPAQAIGAVMVRGALHEVWCHGKPGLVCPDTSGAHTDMDIGTFMAAIPMLAAPFDTCARLGMRPDAAPEGLLCALRARGPAWEANLLAATHGVNTHRGLLFLGSVTCAAAGLAVREGAALTARDICRRAAFLCRGLCRAELARTAAMDGDRLTAGERLFALYGLTGIRGEAEAGLPTVLSCGLPALRQALAEGADLERSLLHALIAIMAGAWDTTVAHRGGLDGLFWLRGVARDVAAHGGALTARGRQKLAVCRQACLARRISPGGAADILAVTIALYLLEHGGWPEHATANRDERWIVWRS